MSLYVATYVGMHVKNFIHFYLLHINNLEFISLLAPVESKVEYSEEGIKIVILHVTTYVRTYS